MARTATIEEPSIDTRTYENSAVIGSTADTTTAHYTPTNSRGPELILGEMLQRGASL